jgi:tetratricopeptide (TPR) repeat protein
MLLWRKRLRAANTAPELAARYDAARRACELSDWRVERVFLELLQVRIRDASSAEFILRHFEGRRDVQKFLAKLILRRAVDPGVVSAVERALFGGHVDWADVDLKLQAIADIDARIAKLREYMARAPEDPNGGMRLVRLLSLADRRDEALALGRKLRDQGLMTPRLAQELGDVLTRAGLEAEAVRTYSEIVEFDPDGRDSRRLLGDIFLGHGWYEPAYRQYRSMTDAAPEDALAQLRLAAAAAGTGRIDEALRLERHVATSEGTPGPSDPRRWARLLSAARLARLIDKPPALLAGESASPERRKESMKRELKELQLFSGPGVLQLLTWEQLDADVELEARSGEAAAAVGDRTDAARAGLSALALAVPEAARVTSAARLRSLARGRALPLLLHEISFDGKDFAVRIERHTLAPGQAALAL